MMTREQAVKFLVNSPYKFGKKIGFDKLKPMHNKWIKQMITCKSDRTLQAHRGSYKTTCVSIALAILIVLRPKARMAFFRKTDSDVRDTIRQVRNILSTPEMKYFVYAIYGIDFQITERALSVVNTNLNTDIKGDYQLTGLGISASLTGKHFDRIFTDDIVNQKDRVSRAEREQTKLAYQEMQNLKNRGGVIVNTGTPWHKDDCFSIMPDPEKYDCYETGLITDCELEEIKSKMIRSLFAVNYELKHIASEDVIFDNPKVGAELSLVDQGVMHLDSAFFGEDYTAWTVANIHDGKYYVYGKIRRKHVEECYDEIIADYQRFNCSRLHNEDNADKGMIARDLRKQGLKVKLYHEDMNKYLKIVTYLKAIWNDVVFVQGTDDDYIEQVVDYNENAEHDDAPDSLASLARVMYKKKSRADEYKPLWN